MAVAWAWGIVAAAMVLAAVYADVEVSNSTALDARPPTFNVSHLYPSKYVLPLPSNATSTSAKGERTDKYNHEQNDALGRNTLHHLLKGIQARAASFLQSRTPLRLRMQVSRVPKLSQDFPAPVQALLRIILERMRASRLILLVLSRPRASSSRCMAGQPTLLEPMPGEITAFEPRACTLTA